MSDQNVNPADAAYAETDALMAKGLRHKGDNENDAAAAIFADVISKLEAMAAVNPCVDTLDRLEDARDFAERTARAEARRLANLAVA
jgi:hypothetical protein